MFSHVQCQVYCIDFTSWINSLIKYVNLSKIFIKENTNNAPNGGDTDEKKLGLNRNPRRHRKLVCDLQLMNGKGIDVDN